MAFDSSFKLRGWLLASLLSAAMTGLGASPAFPAEAGKFWVFVGTYTDGKSKGIYRMEFDPATGKLSEPVLAAEVDNPSCLAVHPTHK
jgi:6-phosphogluconolactonase